LGLLHSCGGQVCRCKNLLLRPLRLACAPLLHPLQDLQADPQGGQAAASLHPLSGVEVYTEVREGSDEEGARKGGGQKNTQTATPWGAAAAQGAEGSEGRPADAPPPPPPIYASGAKVAAIRGPETPHRQAALRAAGDSVNN
jgi:hypothetical protein